MEFCDSCGTKVESSHQRFCGRCGKPLPGASPTPAAPTPGAERSVNLAKPATSSPAGSGAPAAPAGGPGPSSGPGRLVLMVVGGVLAVLVLGGLVWKFTAGSLPDAPQGLAPIPTTFADVNDPGNPEVLVLAGTADDPISNPDYEDGPDRLATSRYRGAFDAPTPPGVVSVHVFSARQWAKIHQDAGEQLDAPTDGMQCWQYTSEGQANECGLDYGNGWVILTGADAGLTGNGTAQDVDVLAAVANSVKANNPFEQAVATHASM